MYLPLKGIQGSSDELVSVKHLGLCLAHSECYIMISLLSIIIIATTIYKEGQSLITCLNIDISNKIFANIMFHFF
jgi:hypothetical protein